MKIICDSAIFAKACINVQSTVSTKSAIPALSGILIRTGIDSDNVNVVGYDLEVGMDTNIPAQVIESGSIVLNAKNLCDIMRRVPDDTVEIESDARNICKITSGKAQYSLVGISSEDYPDIPTVGLSSPIKIKQNILKDMIRKTIFSVSTSDRNPVHKGVKFEISASSLVLVAVDGARLAIKREQIDYNEKDVTFVVPSKTLNEIVKLAEDDESDCNISVGSRHISFTIGDYRIISRLLEGNFIEYKAAIPHTCSINMKVNTKEMIESIERTSLIITDKACPLKCHIEGDKIDFSCVTAAGTARDSIYAEIQGESLDIGFNNKFVLEALRACEDEEVRIEMNSPTQPIVIKPLDGEEYIYLILPVRI